MHRTIIAGMEPKELVAGLNSGDYLIWADRRVYYEARTIERIARHAVTFVQDLEMGRRLCDEFEFLERLGQGRVETRYRISDKSGIEYALKEDPTKQNFCLGQVARIVR